MGFKNFIRESALSVARLAGYNGALPSKVQAAPTQIGTNPNSTYASQQRRVLSMQGENVFKNTSFARNYVYKRRAYCSSGAKWVPNTGDQNLDEEIKVKLNAKFANMGVNCSMLEAFGRVADCFLPQSGDSALRVYRGEDGMKLLEITGDRIGERYTYAMGPTTVKSFILQTADGPQTVEGDFQYYCGLFLDGPKVVAYKIYDRIGDSTYVNPRIYPASEIVYFIDDLDGGLRGVSKFATAIEDVDSRYQILKSTKDAMQLQAKIGIVASNNMGAAYEPTYETQLGLNGQVEYVETFADGAVIKYQTNGDSYQAFKTEQPTEAFIGGMKYVDASAALAVGFPYEFLFGAQDSGGAPSRFAFSIAGREIERIRNEVHRPRLDKIAYLAIMELVADGELPPSPSVTKGSWQFTVLPTADAFRDSQSDIKEDRAGLTTKGEIISRNSGGSFADTLRLRRTEAVMIHKAVAEANAELRRLGLPETITAADLAQNTDNPQQVPVEKKEATPQSAALSAFMGEVSVDSIPRETKLEIEKLIGQEKMNGLRIKKYGMTTGELIPKADAHNMESARKKISYCTIGACGDEVNSNLEKHVLIINDKIVDGHHFLAKAEKGKVSKSIPVLDLIAAP